MTGRLARVAGTLLALLLAAPAAADHAGVADPFPPLPLVDAAVNADRGLAHELDAPLPIEDARTLVLVAIEALATAPACEPWHSLTRAYWEMTGEAFSLGVFGTPVSLVWAYAAGAARILAARHAPECLP